MAIRYPLAHSNITLYVCTIDPATLLVKSLCLNFVTDSTDGMLIKLRNQKVMKVLIGDSNYELKFDKSIEEHFLGWNKHCFSWKASAQFRVLQTNDYVHVI